MYFVLFCHGVSILFVIRTQAANPGAVLEDFIRWYSPRDWIDDEGIDEWGQGKGQYCTSRITAFRYFLSGRDLPLPIIMFHLHRQSNHRLDLRDTMAATFLENYFFIGKGSRQVNSNVKEHTYHLSGYLIAYKKNRKAFVYFPINLLQEYNST